MEVIYTRLAKLTYQKILIDLKKQWTTKQVKDFNQLTEDFLEKIRNHQIECPVVNKSLNIRKGVIHKTVSLFYIQNLEEEKIYLITFFSNRMDPKTLSTLLEL